MWVNLMAYLTAAMMAAKMAELRGDRMVKKKVV